MKTSEYVDEDVQNTFYKGYTHTEDITNLFVFNFFGILIHATFNFPEAVTPTRFQDLPVFTFPSCLKNTHHR